MGLVAEFTVAQLFVGRGFYVSNLVGALRMPGQQIVGGVINPRYSHSRLGLICMLAIHKCILLPRHNCIKMHGAALHQRYVECG